MSERVVRAVEDDVQTLRLGGFEEGDGFFIQGVSAMEKGDVGQVYWAQFS